MSEITFLGFGELASSLAEGLAAADRHRLRAHVRGWPDVTETRAERLSASDVTPCASLSEAVAGADVVLAAVPASAAGELAAAAEAHLKPQAIYAELATAPPADKRAAAEMLARRGVWYADAAVVGTVAVDGFRVPILVSGPGAARLSDVLEPDGFRITTIDGPVGQAALVKLLRSTYLKARDALVVQTLLAARRHGLQDVVADSLDRPGDRLPFEQIAARVLCSVAVHAERRSRELEEVAAVLSEVGVDPALTRAASQQLAGIGRLGLSEVLGEGRPTDPRAVLAAIDELSR